MEVYVVAEQFTADIFLFFLAIFERFSHFQSIVTLRNIYVVFRLKQKNILLFRKNF